MHIWDMDVPIPEPFKDDNHGPTAQCRVEDNDAAHVDTFRQLIQVSAVLESAFRASSHQPIVANCDFINEVARQSRPDDDDPERLFKTMSLLAKWRRSVETLLSATALTSSNAPADIAEPQPKVRSASDRYSVATEQVASIDQMVKLLVGARYLQLETLCPEPRPNMLEKHRAMLINSARDLVALVVQLGAAHLLQRCDIREFQDHFV